MISYLTLIITFNLVFHVIFLHIADPNTLKRALQARVALRLTQAYKAKTWSTYKGMFVTFLSFCEFVNRDIVNLDIQMVLMFIEFLTYNGLKHVYILNYVSTIRSQLKWFELSTDVLDHVKIKLMLKAVAGTIRDLSQIQGNL